MIVLLGTELLSLVVSLLTLRLRRSTSFWIFLTESAKSIASTTGWDTSDQRGSIGKDQEDNNYSGFNLPPSGVRNYNGSFISRGYESELWLITTEDYEYAHHLSLNFSSVSFYGWGGTSLMEYGFSVRFIKE